MSPTDRILNESWISAHCYKIVKIGYILGNMIFMVKVERIALLYPWIPICFLLIITLVLVSLTVTLGITGI